MEAKAIKIAHLADIHIQDRRRAEYAAVFAKLYVSLRAEAPDLIVVAGDVFDNKMRASPTTSKTWQRSCQHWPISPRLCSYPETTIQIVSRPDRSTSCRRYWQTTVTSNRRA